MDPTTTVRTDALPAVASVLIPGLIAGLPYLALLWGEPHNVGDLASAFPVAALIVGTLCVVGLGMAIESLGSYVEYYVFDRYFCRDESSQERSWTWWLFLNSAWEHEPVGFEYLKRLLVTFKFELNTAVALVTSLVGTALLAWHGVLTVNVSLRVALGTALFATALFFAAIDTSNVLAKVRRGLLKATNVVQ